MRRILLSLSFLLVSWAVLPFMANGQKQDGMKPTSGTILRHYNDSRRFKRFASSRKQMNTKLASQLSKAAADVSVPDKAAYGFLLPGETAGLSTFNMSDPTKITTLYPIDIMEEPHISGGAYAEGKYYSYYVQITPYGTMPVSFGYMDIETGDITDVASYVGVSFNLADMTYDYSTKTMYVLYEDLMTETYSLSTVDLENGEIKQIAPLNGDYFCLAATYDGILYAIDGNGDLVILNKQTGRPSVVGNTGIKPHFYQSMDFDHTDGTLYWAAMDETYQGYFCVVDLANGKATVIEHLGNDDEVAGLHIPYTLPADNVPGAVTDLKFVPEENGASNATISWTNPGNTFGGSQLSGLTKVEVYRDNELVYTINPVSTLQALTWKDTEVSTGMHVYKVVPYNSEGKGAVTSVLGYVGRDVPAAVSGVSLVKIDDTTGKLTWKAPAEGRYGGWIDRATLTYRITRYPDEKVMVESQTATEYTDNTITTLKRYSYLIETFTSDGSGDKTVSQEVVLGPALNLPYSTTFKDDAEISVWTNLDNDHDGYAWEFEPWFADLLGPRRTGASLAEGGGENRTYDDWLISPPFSTEKRKAYRVVFNMRTYEGYTVNLKMKVTLGKEATAEAQTIDLGICEVSTSKEKSCVVSLPDNLEAGNYNVGFHILYEDHFTIVQITGVTIEEDVTGHITGKVSDNQTGKDLEEAVVSLSRGGKAVYSAQTDTDGNYLIQWIEEGDYELSIDKKGYEVVKKSVRIEALETITENASLTALPTYFLTGKVIDASGVPMEGVKIEISGYDRCTVTTGAQGTFSIPSLYRSSKYYIAAFKSLYLPYLSALSLTGNKDLGNITLQVNSIPPTQATAEANETVVDINWSVPVEAHTFRYDSDIPANQFGFTDGNEYGIFGSVHRVPAMLGGMSWKMNGEGGPHEKVNVYVMDLDESGQPTSKVLFSEKGVSNTDNEWSSYTFPYPVEAPNGFMIAISYDKGYMAIASAESTDEYPFLKNTNFYTSDYRSGQYNLLENTDSEENLMIRAEGVPMYKPVNSTKINKALTSATTVAYTVYRLKSGDEDNRANWQPVVSGIAGTSYTDNTWAQVESGIYRYAVAAVYDDQKESSPAFTEEVFKDMDTEVEIHIELSDGKPLGFAAVVLENLYNLGDSHMETFDENGDVTLNLTKGYYRLTVVSSGYKKLIIDRMDFSEEKHYSESYTLYPDGPVPFNLKEENRTGNDCTISWNNKTAVSDGFEEHESFTVNFPGEAGWTYIDGDEKETELIGGLDFPNAGSKMAYIVMSPNDMEISDEVRETLEANTGSKYLVSVVTKEGKNDDYIISPELKFGKDFILTFYAKSYTEQYGLEEMRIGYSYAGNRKEDFIWLTEKPVQVSDTWMHYIYNIPAEAKYVTVNCVSNNRFFFMLDDIFIGTRAELENQACDFSGIVYSVYLDNEKVGTTTETTYTFTNLSKGDHTVGIQANYEEGFSEIITLLVKDPDSIGQVEENSSIRVYPNPVIDRLYIKGDYTQATVTDMSGNVLATQESGDYIEMNGYAKGLYMVRIADNDRVNVYKIVVK